MTGTIDIMCTVPAPTLEQVRAWLTRTGWEVDTLSAPQNERWNHPVHGRAWVPREELADWLAYISNWIANRAWQIESTPEAVYREIVGPTHAEALFAVVRHELDFCTDGFTVGNLERALCGERKAEPHRKKVRP